MSIYVSVNAMSMGRYKFLLEVEVLVDVSNLWKSKTHLLAKKMLRPLEILVLRELGGHKMSCRNLL